MEAVDASRFSRRLRSMSSGSGCCAGSTRRCRRPSGGGGPHDDHARAPGRQAGRVGRVGGVEAGVRAGGVDPELVEARPEVARRSEALKEMGVRLMLAEGKGRWG